MLNLKMSEKILIRGVNWIGDAVMTIPAIRAVRAAHPDSKISLLVKPTVAAVFEGNRDIDEIILYEERHKGVLGRFKLAYLLRKKKFNRAILFQNAFDAALIAFLAGIPERIGYDRDGRGFLLTKPVPFNNEDRKLHHINYYLNLLNLAGIKANYSEPWIVLSIEERMAARERLSRLKRPILGINPGAAYGSTKRWLPERFAEVAAWFIKDAGGSVLLVGSNNEAEIAYEIEKTIKMEHTDTNISLIDNYPLLNLVGKTSLRELIALISECDVFLSNDSGPMHIACAVGTNLVAIFGSTDPKLTGPYGYDSAVIKKDFLCSPCFERICKNNDMRCMCSVTSEDVYFCIKDMLPIKKAVFFDRDGTLCRDADYLNDWKNFEVFREVESLKELKDKGLMLIGVSNQSGIGRGIVDEQFVKDVNQVFIDKYGFDDFYYCPHHPDDRCTCRKPEPGMLLEAKAKYKINLRKSYVVGDKDADMLLAKAVGAKGILVQTGKQQASSYADATVNSLVDVVEIIFADERNKH